MAAPTITDLPEVPPTNDADFETKAPALFNAIKNTFVGEVNNFGDYLNTADWLTLALGLSANKLTYSDGTGDVVVATELHWDSVNKRLGIGTSSPSKKLDLKIDSDNENFAFFRRSNNSISHNFAVNSTGDAEYYLYDSTSVKVLLNTNGNSYFNGGNVGIGKNSPSTTLDVNGPIKCASYIVATVPSASSSGAGAQIYVTDETGGAVPCFSDGTNWRRVTDRAIIS